MGARNLHQILGHIIPFPPRGGRLGWGACRDVGCYVSMSHPHLHRSTELTTKSSPIKEEKMSRWKRARVKGGISWIVPACGRQGDEPS